MRLSQRSAFGLVFGGSIALASGLAGTACSGNDFNGCEAARTCGSPAAGAAGASGASTAGRGGENAGGKAGQGGGGGLAGNANGGKSTKPGDGGGGEAGSPDEQSSAGNGHETSGSGGTRHGSNGGAGSGATGPASPPSDGGNEDGSDSRAGAAGETSGSGHDTKAPSIVAVSPPYGATGVTKDTEIVIDFDEPMDNAKTEAAYQSAELPPDAVNLYWRNDSKELVVQPKLPLVYADVSLPTADAKHYEFTIAGSATDAAGNALGQDQHYAFTTLRHITHFLLIPEHGGRLLSQPADGDMHRLNRCPGFDSMLQAGDASDGGYYFSLITFDLSSLPPGIVEWDSAELGALIQARTSVNPFRLGYLELYGLVVDPDEVVWDSPVATSLGPLSTYLSNQTPRVDVSDAVKRDYAARAAQSNRSQYLVRFDEQTDGDGRDAYLQFACDSVRLYLEYLAP